MAHYYYASLLQTVDQDGGANQDSSRYELMLQHLKKCIELAPGYLNAYEMLGYVALRSRSELRETQNLLMQAMASSPGRREIRLRVGELMIANDEHQAARVVLFPLKDGEDAVNRRAQSLVEYIEKYLENQRALREYEAQRRAAAEAAAAEAVAVEEKPTVADAGRDEPRDERPTLTRTARSSNESNRTVETATPARINRPAGLEIEGVLISADCTRGLTLRLRVGNGNVELHSNDPSKIEFLSYTTAVSNSFACGSFASAPPPVHIVYRRSGDARYLGEPLRVEFVEKK
jgi:hypothetical protein